MKKAWIIVGVVVVVAAILVGVFINQKNNLQKQVDDLTAQVATLTKELADAKAALELAEAEAAVELAEVETEAELAEAEAETEPETEPTDAEAEAEPTAAGTV